jgi:hypothetical protein
MLYVKTNDFLVGYIFPWLIKMAMAHTVKYLCLWPRSGFEDGCVAFRECRQGRPDGVMGLAGALVQ